MELHFTWDQYWKDQPRESQRWATSDRGWVKVEPHPQHMPDEYATVGFYLHYYDAHGQCEDRGILAKAYVFKWARVYVTQDDLGYTYVRTVDEAKAWIEEKVKQYVDKLATIPA